MPSHPYFVGTQAHPEFKSRPDRPHPLFRGLIDAANLRAEGREPHILDPNTVEEMLRRVHARNPIHTAVMDTTRAEQLAEWIRTEIGADVIDRPQSNPFAVTDYEAFMDALRTHRLYHSGDAGLASHALNAIAKMLPGGQVRFDRPAAARVSSEQPRRVIDALTAASMVHSSAAQPAEPVPEAPGFLTFYQELAAQAVGAVA